MLGRKKQTGTVLVVCQKCSELVRADIRMRNQSARCPGCYREVKLDGGRVCDHVAFISYSHKDKTLAERVCDSLERSDIRCWIAHRDIKAGQKWGAAIVEAIEGSRVLVLVHSSHSNRSQQVLREVERAVAKRVVIVPLRVEEIALSKDLEYFLGTVHWLDGTRGSLNDSIETLLSMVRLLLSEKITPSAGPVVPRSRRRMLRVISMLLMVANSFVLGYVSSLVLRWPTREEITAELVQSIESVVSPASWESAGGPYTIDAFDGTLSVRADREIQAEVHAFLSEMRAERSLPPQPADTRDEPPAVLRLLSALEETSDLEFLDIPLADAVDAFEAVHAVPILIDTTSLDQVGLSHDVEVTCSLRDTPFRTALRVILEPLGLTYLVGEEGIVITTPEIKADRPVVRSYNIDDLLDVSGSSLFSAFDVQKRNK